MTAFVDRFRLRPNLRVEIIGEVFGNTLDFEAENVGQVPTSISRFVGVKGWAALAHGRRRLLFGRRWQALYVLDGQDRLLQPHTPRRFSAGTVAMPKQPVVFRTYTFRPTKGRVRKVREVHQFTGPVPPWTFVWGLLRFRLGGEVPYRSAIPKDRRTVGGRTDGT